MVKNSVLAIYAVLIVNAIYIAALDTTVWMPPKLRFSRSRYDAQRITCIVHIPQAARSSPRVRNPPRFIYLNDTRRGSVAVFQTDRPTQDECYASRNLSNDLPEKTKVSCVYDEDLKHSRKIVLILRPFTLYDASKWTCGAIIDDDPNDAIPPQRLETTKSKLYDDFGVQKHLPLTVPFPTPRVSVTIDWRATPRSVELRCHVPDFNATAAYEEREYWTSRFKHPAIVDFELDRNRIRGDFFGRYLASRRKLDGSSNRVGGTLLPLREIDCNSTLPPVECFVASWAHPAFPALHRNICGRFTRLSDERTYDMSTPSMNPYVGTFLSLDDQRISEGVTLLVDDTLIVHTPPKYKEYNFQPVGPKQWTLSLTIDNYPRTVAAYNRTHFVPIVYPSHLFARRMSEHIMRLFSLYRRVEINRWAAIPSGLSLSKSCSNGVVLFVTKPKCVILSTGITKYRWFGDYWRATWCRTHDYIPVARPAAEIESLQKPVQCAHPIYYCFTLPRSRPPKLILRPPIDASAAVDYRPGNKSDCRDNLPADSAGVSPGIDLGIRLAAEKHFFLTDATTKASVNESQCPCELITYFCRKSGVESNVAASTRILLSDIIAFKDGFANERPKSRNVTCGAFGRRSPTLKLETALTSAACSDRDLMTLLRTGELKDPELFTLFPKPIMTIRRIASLAKNTSLSGMRVEVRCAVSANVPRRCKDAAKNTMVTRVFVNKHNASGVRTVKKHFVDESTFVAEIAVDPLWERRLSEISCAYSLDGAVDSAAKIKSVRKIVWRDIWALYAETCLPSDYTLSISRSGFRSANIACRASNYAPGCGPPAMMRLSVNDRTISACRVSGKGKICQTQSPAGHSWIRGVLNDNETTSAAVRCYVETATFAVNVTKNIDHVLWQCIPPPRSFVPEIIVDLGKDNRVQIICEYPDDIEVEYCTRNSGPLPTSVSTKAELAFGGDYTDTVLLTDSKDSDNPCAFEHDEFVEKCFADPLPSRSFVRVVLSPGFFADAARRTRLARADRLAISIRCIVGDKGTIGVPVGAMVENLLKDWKSDSPIKSTTDADLDRSDDKISLAIPTVRLFSTKQLLSFFALRLFSSLFGVQPA